MENWHKYATAAMFYAASGLGCYAWILTNSDTWMVVTMLVKLCGHAAILSVNSETVNDY